LQAGAAEFLLHVTRAFSLVECGGGDFGDADLAGEVIFVVSFEVVESFADVGALEEGILGLERQCEEKECGKAHEFDDSGLGRAGSSPPWGAK